MHINILFITAQSTNVDRYQKKRKGILNTSQEESIPVNLVNNGSPLFLDALEQNVGMYFFRLIEGERFPREKKTRCL